MSVTTDEHTLEIEEALAERGIKEGADALAKDDFVGPLVKEYLDAWPGKIDAAGLIRLKGRGITPGVLRKLNHEKTISDVVIAWTNYRSALPYTEDEEGTHPLRASWAADLLVEDVLPETVPSDFEAWMGGMTKHFPGQPIEAHTGLMFKRAVVNYYGSSIEYLAAVNHLNLLLSLDESSLSFCLGALGFFYQRKDKVADRTQEEARRTEQFLGRLLAARELLEDLRSHHLSGIAKTKEPLLTAGYLLAAAEKLPLEEAVYFAEQLDGYSLNEEETARAIEYHQTIGLEVSQAAERALEASPTQAKAELERLPWRGTQNMAWLLEVNGVGVYDFYPLLERWLEAYPNLKLVDAIGLIDPVTAKTPKAIVRYIEIMKARPELELEQHRDVNWKLAHSEVAFALFMAGTKTQLSGAQLTAISLGALDAKLGDEAVEEMKKVSAYWAGKLGPGSGPELTTTWATCENLLTKWPKLDPVVLAGLAVGGGDIEAKLANIDVLAGGDEQIMIDMLAAAGKRFKDAFEGIDQVEYLLPGMTGQGLVQVLQGYLPHDEGRDVVQTAALEDLETLKEAVGLVPSYTLEEVCYLLEAVEGIQNLKAVVSLFPRGKVHELVAAFQVVTTNLTPEFKKNNPGATIEIAIQACMANLSEEELGKSIQLSGLRLMGAGRKVKSEERDAAALIADQNEIYQRWLAKRGATLKTPLSRALGEGEGAFRIIDEAKQEFSNLMIDIDTFLKMPALMCRKYPPLDEFLAALVAFENLVSSGSEQELNAAAAKAAQLLKDAKAKALEAGPVYAESLEDQRATDYLKGKSELVQYRKRVKTVEPGVDGYDVAVERIKAWPLEMAATLGALSLISQHLPLGAIKELEAARAAEMPEEIEALRTPAMAGGGRGMAM